MEQDFTSLYSIACTVSRAETLKAKNIQNDSVRELIKKYLKHDKPHLIFEALELCEKYNNHYERKLIENHYIDLVTTLYTNEDMINSRTDLILIPILVSSDKEVGKMVKLSTVEEKLEKTLKDNYFIPVTSNLFLYSVLFNKEKVNSFTLADWYKLHNRIVNSREQSINQSIYKKNFGIPLTPNKTSLFYFVGIVSQNKKLVEDVEPELFDRRQMNLEDKKNFLSQINNHFKEFSTSTKYEVIMPDDIFRSVEEAKYREQDALIHHFVSTNTKIENIEFFISSLEIGVCLFAYNKSTHKVINKMKILNYGNHSDQENIDNIFDALADNKTFVYIAKDIQPEGFYDNTDNFHLEDFLANNEFEKFMPNLLENNDIYL